MKNFKELEGTIIYYELEELEEQNVKSSVTKIIASNPDAVFIGTNYQFINLVKELRQQGYEGNLYSIEVFEYLAETTKEYSTGLEFISSNSFKDEFNEEFRRTYGKEPNIPSGQSYDAAMIAINFLKQTTDKDEIIQLMKNFTHYEGVTGNITITDDRTLMPMAIYRLDNGKIIKIKDI